MPAPCLLFLPSSFASAFPPNLPLTSSAVPCTLSLTVELACRRAAPGSVSCETDDVGGVRSCAPADEVGREGAGGAGGVVGIGRGEGPGARRLERLKGAAEREKEACAAPPASTPRSESL
ncbi:hypothetical protein DMC30DRAFT_391151 [Rhodotorula diobovata]|uniref:Secreted protein n=1 Tax=Rhodotorula diobovata TaxID=5288 RepID=A0A5C5G1P2_9BASI|nr:hypothetical protein DMC30DRAFT_391151 [Rhodotorula diobovata]